MPPSTPLTRSRAALVLLAATGAVAGCETIAGIGDRSLGPADGSGASPTGAAGAGGGASSGEGGTGGEVATGGSGGQATGGAGGSTGGAGGAATKRIFVTLDDWNGNFLGKGGGSALDNADALCQKAANDASLGGVWVAWLSGSGVDARNRIDNVGPWVLVGSGEEVFADKGDIFTGPQVPIDHNEWGQPISSANGVWTGTAPDGSLDSPTCSSWSSAAVGYNGRRGNPANTDGTWTSMVGTLRCDYGASLYCFEQ